MLDLKARLAPSGKRSLSVTGERLVLFGIIVLLFALDYSFGVLHGTVRILESSDSTIGSAVLAIAVASWVGVFAYAFRRRFDLTEILLAKAEAERNAETAGICDALTGLPNRHGLKVELARRLREEAGIATALIALDVTRFKSLNEMHGHVVADRVLIELSDRLAMAVSATDFVARVGPDEFNVLTRVRDADTAELRALQIVHTIAMRLDEFDPPVPITADAGVTLFGVDGDVDVDVIMRRAEIALETAKSRDSSVARFTEDMEQAIRERAEL